MDRQKPFPAIFLYLLMAQNASSPHDRSPGVWGMVLHPRIGMDPKVEMAELYVNDRFCDVGFWAPQRLRIPENILKNGENRLRLVITGSRANPVWKRKNILRIAAGRCLRASVIHGRFTQNVTFSEPLTNPLSIQPIIIQVPSSLLPLRYRGAMMTIALYHSLLFINHPVC